MISSNIRKRIIDETSIVEVVSEYVKLEKKGNSHFGLCPFHDDQNPSMSVSDNVKMFNCFSCGTKGNVIYFVSKIENISMDQATIKLGKRLGIVIKDNISKEEEKLNRLYDMMDEATNFYKFYLKNSEEGLEALKYLHNRGISDEIIDTFNIGLAPNIDDALNKYLLKKNYLELDLIEAGLARSDEKRTVDVFKHRIMFPLANAQGRTVGFSGRIYYESNLPKYLNSNDNTLFHKSLILYNLHNAYNEAHKKDKLYLFEGFMDVIAAYRCGIGNGVATMGTALTQDHIKMMLSITKNIVLCFDGDEAGIKAMRRSAELLANYNLIPEAVVLPNNQDPDEYIKEFGASKLNNYLTNEAKPVYSWLYKLAKNRLVKGDLLSVENFKKEVFSFLITSKQSTVVEFYMNELAKDLEINISALANDYNKFSRRETITPKKEEPKKQVKKDKIPIKIKPSYGIIILHALNNYKDLIDYNKELKDGFIKDFYIEYSILSEITSLDSYYKLESNPNRKEILIKQLSATNSSYKEYLDNLNNTYCDLDNHNELMDCINNIKLYLKKLETQSVKNRISQGLDDPESIVESKRKELNKK